MSAERDGEWVLVKSESELRVGMAVEFRPCACGKIERTILLEDLGVAQMTTAGGALTGPARLFNVLDTCPFVGYEGKQATIMLAFSIAIHEGRLWRLADDSSSHEDVTATRPLELETVR